MKNQKMIEGVIPPFITPLDDKGSVIEEDVDRLIEKLLDAGIEAFFLLGTMGEGPLLPDDQKRVLIRRAVKTAAGRAKIIVNCSETSTNRIISIGKMAEDLGCDMLASTLPIYLPMENQQAICDFYSGLASIFKVPFIIYDIPKLVNGKIFISSLTQLSKEDNIIGIKDSSGDFHRFRELLYVFRERDDFSLFTGDEWTLDASLLTGADGFVPGIGCLVPDICLALYQACKENDIAKAVSLQDKLIGLFSIYGEYTREWDAGMKEALYQLGLFRSNAVARPMPPVNAEVRKRVSNILSEYGIK